MKTKSPPKPIVRLRLSEIMKQRNLKPDDVVFMCRAAGFTITRTTIYNLKSGKARFDTLTALCNGLEVTPGDLLVLE